MRQLTTSAAALAGRDLCRLGQRPAAPSLVVTLTRHLARMGQRPAAPSLVVTLTRHLARMGRRYAPPAGLAALSEPTIRPGRRFAPRAGLAMTRRDPALVGPVHALPYAIGDDPAVFASETLARSLAGHLAAWRKALHGTEGRP